MRKLILIGAGGNGIEALHKFGNDNVIYFCDNNEKIHGTQVEGIEVIPFEKMISLYDKNKHVIMVTPNNNSFLIGQLELSNIKEYVLYQKKKSINILSARLNDEKNFASQNEILNYYNQESQKLDLLSDVSEFKKLVEEVLRKSDEGMTLVHYGIGEEGNYYGNLDTLLEYADYQDFDKICAPTVSHNAIAPLKTTETMFDSAIVFSGNYYKNKIHRWKPYIPVFSVGPYIQYAKGIYDADRISTMKKQNGKTLMIYLPHSIENISRNYSKKSFIDDVLKMYKDNFDTIYMSVYWADLLDPCCEYAESKGIKVVSSGFRFDPIFTKRLRSILELSDAVIGGDIGTHYNYSMNMKIPAARLEISDNQTINDKEYCNELHRKILFDEYYNKYQEVFYEVYGNEFKCNEKQRKWLEPYAGYRIRRSKEYIRTIFDISKDIMMGCNGDLIKYPCAVRKKFGDYNEEGNYEKMQILAEAVGSYIYFE